MLRDVHEGGDLGSRLEDDFPDCFYVVKEESLLTTPNIHFKELLPFLLSHVLLSKYIYIRID